MHEFVSFNNQILPAQNPALQAISSAAFYGKSIFTTLAVYREKPFLWEKHWRRIIENARRLEINLGAYSEKATLAALEKVIKRNKLLNGRARLTFFDESSGGAWKPDDALKTALLITTGDFRSPPKNLALMISEYPVNSRSPLANVKSGNYLENILALNAANKLGFDEAVRINEKGEVVSACVANIFWIKDNEISTSHLETGALRGTTRDLIKEKFPVFERKTGSAEIENADAVFLTSAGIGIAEVRFFNRIEYRNCDKLNQIRTIFERFMENS